VGGVYNRLYFHPVAGVKALMKTLAADASQEN